MLERQQLSWYPAPHWAKSLHLPANTSQLLILLSTGLCGNGEWDWLFTRLSCCDPLLAKGDHRWQVLRQWASDDGCWWRIPLETSSQKSVHRQPGCDGHLLLKTLNQHQHSYPDQVTKQPFSRVATNPEKLEK